MANANVFMSLLQPVKSVQDYDDERDAREVRQLALQDKRRASSLAESTAAQQASDQNALQRLAGESGGDENKLIQLLRGSGSVGLADMANAREKAMLERRNTESQIGERTVKTSAEQMKAAIDRLGLVGQLAGGVRDQATYQAALNFLGASGIDVQQLGAPAQYDPQVVERFRTQAVSEKDRLEQSFKERQQQETERNNKAQVGATIRGQDVTASTAIRGQNLVDARAKDANSLTREANANVYDPERGVLVNKVTGLARPAATMDGRPIGTKDKPLTDSQAKAYAFGTRMAAANKIIDGLANEGTNANVPGMNAGFGVGRVVTALSTENQQKLEQAKRDWVNANLRRESGAVIGQSEFDSADRQYFPQPGDSPAVIKQKAANRKMAEQGVLAEVPAGYRPSQGGAPASPAANNDPLGLRDILGGK